MSFSFKRYRGWLVRGWSRASSHSETSFTFRASSHSGFSYLAFPLQVAPIPKVTSWPKKAANRKISMQSLKLYSPVLLTSTSQNSANMSSIAVSKAERYSLGEGVVIIHVPSQKSRFLLS